MSLIDRIRARKRRGIKRPHSKRLALPKTLVLEYTKAIERVLAGAESLVRARIFPRLASLARTRTDAPDLHNLLDELSKVFFNAATPDNLARLVSRFANRTNDFQRDQWRELVKAELGIDLFSDPSLRALLQSFTTENVALIRSIPTQLFDEVEKVVAGAFRAQITSAELAKQIERRFAVSRSRSQLIARDQIGKLFGSLAQERQSDIGITGYIWRTVRDSRVRDSHEHREGKRFLWSNAPADGHPGQAIQCRCYAEPDFDSISDE